MTTQTSTKIKSPNSTRGQQKAHPSSKDPSRQPYSWYARFAEPYPLPDVAPSDKVKISDKEIASRITELNKDLAHAERASAGLRQRVTTLCRSNLHKPAQTWDAEPDSLFKAAARAAIAHSENLTLQVDIRRQISELNARIAE